MHVEELMAKFYILEEWNFSSSLILSNSFNVILVLRPKVVRAKASGTKCDKVSL